VKRSALAGEKGSMRSDEKREEESLKRVWSQCEASVKRVGSECEASVKKSRWLRKKGACEVTRSEKKRV
jgi:hypothetical protein